MRWTPALTFSNTPVVLTTWMVSVPCRPVRTKLAEVRPLIASVPS